MHISRLLSSVLLLALPAVSPRAAAQSPSPQDSVSATVSGIAYTINFDRTTASRRMVEVEMSFTVTEARPVLLSLPAWTPGAYEISNFARNVIAFDAVSEGQPLRWDKLDHDTWRVQAGAGKRVTVSFAYLGDSLDTAKLWVQPDFTLVNGTNVFFYLEGRPLEFPATVTVNTEPDWLVATGMNRDGPQHRYSASNYHDLVDMPFFIGRFDLDSARISDSWVRFASYPSGSVAGADRRTVWRQLEQVVPPMVAVFGDVPWDSYTVMQIIDSSFAGASGLEHQNSHVDILSPPFVGSDFQPSLYAHEIVHAWNVKRLRPSDLWPYVYWRPQPTTWLWMSEGITDYYADLALVRGGVIDEGSFWRVTQGKIAEVESAPPTALEDASLSAWIHPVDGTAYLYYPQGSLVGFVLDVMIRDASDNANSLDTVMRELYRSTYGQGRGFDSTDFWGAVTRAAGGKSFADLYTRHVDGREPLPWETILPLAGLRASRDRAPRLGVYSQGDVNGVVVTAVEPGGAAEVAGVRPGDILLSVADIAVDDLLFGPKFREKFATSPEGTPVPLRVRRAGELLTLNASLRFAPGELRLEPDPGATEKAVRIRNAIVGK